MRIGDLVSRKSYGGDIAFRIEHFMERQVILKGIQYRLLADSPLSDLTPVRDPSEVRDFRDSQAKLFEAKKVISEYRKFQRSNRTNELAAGRKRGHAFFDLPGKVLHLDGDPNYLQKSLAAYRELLVPAEGYYVHESSMPYAVRELLPRVKPDIVVITGHDGFLKHKFNGQEVNVYDLDNYKNSQNFADAVHAARLFERNKDTLTVVAGACQSHFEALLQAGANFASSPGRILIHALDPVYIACKAAYTSIKEVINIYDVISRTVSGLEGMGGIETRGSYRIGMPKLSQLNKPKPV